MIDVTDDTLYEEVKKHDICIVDVYGTWCQPCRAMAIIINSLNESDFTFVKIDVDSNKKVAENYGLRSVPSFLIFKNGEHKGIIVGSLPRDKFIQKIRSIVGE